jgi:hypothetical protein
MLHEIARWKFKQDDVAPGTVLARDDFEKGLGRWTILAGDWDVVDGKGVGTSRCLRLKWKAGERPVPLILFDFVPRYKNFEIRFDFLVPPTQYSMGPTVFGPDRTRVVNSRVTGGFRGTMKVEAGKWRMHSRVIRGTKAELTCYHDGKRLYSMTHDIVNDAIGGVGIMTVYVKEDTEMLIDNLVVRKLSDAPTGEDRKEPHELQLE